MPINTPHPNYAKLLPLWARCRDSFAGEDAIKARGDVYLPRLSGQNDTEYDAYRSRAMYYAAMKRTTKAMSGAVLFREPTITLPAEIDQEYLGAENESLMEILRKTLEEVLVVGRVGVLADMPVAIPGSPPPQPYLCFYLAESIYSWKHSKGEKERRLTQVVLQEKRDVVKSGDSWVTECEVFYRVLQLGFPAPVTDEEMKMPTEAFLASLGLRFQDIADNPNGIYFQEIYERMVASDGKQTEQWVLTRRIFPRRLGGSFWTRIPFTFFNPTSTLPTPEDPPLLDLVNVTLSHYRNSADLEHGRHFTALPTPYAIGFNLKAGQELCIGSTKAWISEEPNAKAGFLEFTGAGLGHLQTGMEAKEKLMAVLGARLLTEPKAGVESEGAIALRQGGEKSALAEIAGAIQEGAEMILVDLADWLNIQNAADAVEVEINKDFFIAALSPSLISSLLMAVQQGQLSWNSWFFNLKRADLIPSDVTEEDERGRIGLSSPGVFNTTMGETAGTIGNQEPAADGTDPAAKVGLNGAQIQAARSVLLDIAGKTLTQVQGIELLLAVGIPEDAAKRLVGTAKK